LTSLICLDQTMFDPHTAKLCSVFKVPTCVLMTQRLISYSLVDFLSTSFRYFLFAFNCLSLRKRFLLALKTFTTLPCFFFFVNFYLLIVFSAKRQEVL
jgi:hypothetical protein